MTCSVGDGRTESFHGGSSGGNGRDGNDGSPGEDGRSGLPGRVVVVQ